MSSDNCGALDILAAQDNVTRIPFENTPTIERYHFDLPRLSANRDLLDDSYNTGWVGFGFAYVFLFLIWALILGVLKWKKLGGWLSGSRNNKDKAPESSDNDKAPESSASESQTVPKKQSMVLRGVLYTTILAIIIANGTLFFTGLEDLTAATNAGLETLDQAEAQMKLSVCLFEQVIGDVELAETETQTLLETANNICPKITNSFCRVLSDPTSCDGGSGRRLQFPSLPDPCDYFPDTCDTLSDIWDDVQGVIQRLTNGIQAGIEFFQQEDALKTKLQEIRDDVDGQIEAKLVEAKGQLETTKGMVIFSSVLCWMSILVCLGLLTAHFLKKTFLLKIFFGLFLLITILTLVAAVTNAIAAFVVSDLCIDDPDSRAIDLLLLRLDLKSAVLQDAFRVFLVNMSAGNCAEQPPTQFLLDSIDFLQTGMNAFDGWSNFFWGSDRIQQAACGADAQSMKEIEELMDNSINKGLNSTSTFLEVGGRLFTCSFWMGLFEKGLHQAVCYDGMDALATVSLVQFIVLCMCMLVVTFRVALWDILEVS